MNRIEFGGVYLVSDTLYPRQRTQQIYMMKGYYLHVLSSSLSPRSSLLRYSQSIPATVTELAPVSACPLR